MLFRAMMLMIILVLNTFEKGKSNWGMQSERLRKMSHRCGFRDNFCCKTDLSECATCSSCGAGTYTQGAYAGGDCGYYGVTSCHPTASEIHDCRFTSNGSGGSFTKVRNTGV